MNILERTSNNINIATFWENYSLKKYNLSPSYQREGEVWSGPDQSYLIDTILKNFPMPPIFLHQHIDNQTGKTIYDVIDGKQRLGAIIGFLNNEIAIPEDFSEDGFGSSELEGLYFKDLDSPEISAWKKNLWKYEITIEYVETDDIGVVNHIFDRLNRNGEPLTHQELRNAKYGDTGFYKLIKDISDREVFSRTVDSLSNNRLENHEFISELMFLITEDKVIAGDKPKDIDELYEKYTALDTNQLDAIKDQVLNIENVFSTFNLNFDDKRFHGVSHIYGLWGLAWKLHKDEVAIEDIDEKITEFFLVYKRKDDSNEYIETYRATMSGGTKGSSRRKRRIDALLNYMKQT
ncbi:MULTISPECIES: DUF262 domain-containing protein [unclassified Pseudoalteromonas]|uniref:DUF262 domain-containing protein n=1 Tax=unclassified Pseudoalteromonas TaxID=194690 RepID=UPI0005A813AE|nr:MULTISPECIES: DUF262 domain-containing protein [unclassified Pseudoalteromonas]